MLQLTLFSLFGVMFVVRSKYCFYCLCGFQMLKYKSRSFIINQILVSALLSNMVKKIHLTIKFMQFGNSQFFLCKIWLKLTTKSIIFNDQYGLIKRQLVMEIILNPFVLGYLPNMELMKLKAKSSQALEVKKLAKLKCQYLA